MGVSRELAAELATRIVIAAIENKNVTLAGPTGTRDALGPAGGAAHDAKYLTDLFRLVQATIQNPA